MKIGTKIRAIREQKKYSQEYMAELLQMSVNGYGKIERNEVDVNIEKLQKIADALDIQPENLLSEGLSFNMNGDNYNNLYYFSTIYDQSAKIEKLYQEQIELLKEKITALEAQLKQQQ